MDDKEKAQFCYTICKAAHNLSIGLRKTAMGAFQWGDAATGARISTTDGETPQEKLYCACLALVEYLNSCPPKKS